ncbi:MAG: hypothetical protein NVS2B14_21940 [Chamaesiphon sp.]
MLSNSSNPKSPIKNPMTSAYQLKPWTQVVTPQSDILEGRLDSSTYAASLSG